MKIEFIKGEDGTLSHAYIASETEEEAYYLKHEILRKGVSLHSDWMVSHDDGRRKISMSISVSNGKTVNGLED